MEKEVWEDWVKESRGGKRGMVIEYSSGVEGRQACAPIYH